MSSMCPNPASIQRNTLFTDKLIQQGTTGQWPHNMGTQELLVIPGT